MIDWELVNKNNSNSLYKNFFAKRFLIYGSLFLFVFISIAGFFFVNDSTQSLIAHDEGLYARRASIIVNTNNWFNPFDKVHHKTIGSYWLIALAIKFLGNTDFAVRIPSFIFSLLSIVLFFLIAKKICNLKVAYVSTIYLISLPLWIQYSRYASPDMPYLFFTLLPIYSITILSTDYRDQSRDKFYIFLMGISFSLSFLVRSFMILMPIIALTPLYVLNIKNIKFNNYIYFLVGLIIGLIPSIYNLFLLTSIYGNQSYMYLFEFLQKKSLGEFALNNKIYFIIILFIYSFPASIYSVFSSFRRRYEIKKNITYIVYIYPLIMLLMLLGISSSHYQYSLQLMPSLSLLSGLFIVNISKDIATDKVFIRYLYITNIFVFIILFVAIVFMINNSLTYFTFYKYSYILTLVSFALVNLLSFVYIYKFSKLNLTKFIYISLITPVTHLIFINYLYNIGAIGSPNKTIKSFVSDNIVREISRNYTINLFDIDSKTNTLLEFYLLKSRNVVKLDEINPNAYILTEEDNLRKVFATNEYQIIKCIDQSDYILAKIKVKI